MFPKPAESESSLNVERSEDRKNVDEVHERFQMRFIDLRERGGRLSTALREISRGLSENGRPPSSPLIGDLRRFKGDFRELQSQWRSSGEREGHQSGPAVEVESLSDLERELECRLSVRGALAMLDRLDAIRLTDERDAAPWERCLSEGRAIRSELALNPPSSAVAHASRLLSGEHPLGAAVTLITDCDELSDERWRALHDAVAEVYGRDLATAIVRQRLTMPSVETGVASNGS